MKANFCLLIELMLSNPVCDNLQFQTASYPLPKKPWTGTAKRVAILKHTIYHPKPLPTSCCCQLFLLFLPPESTGLGIILQYQKYWFITLWWLMLQVLEDIYTGKDVLLPGHLIDLTIQHVHVTSSNHANMEDNILILSYE